MTKFLSECFYRKSIYKHVESLVDMGVNRYQDLTDSQRYKISALIIRELGADDFESLTGSDNCSDTMGIFAEALFNNSEESDKKLLTYIKNNAVANHGWQIDELIYEIKSTKRVGMMIENGFIPSVDNINGELTWRKSA